MKIKVDDKGAVVLSETGNPVYVDPNGADIEVDVPTLYKKVEELNAESAKHRKQRNEEREKLKVFEGIEDLTKWKSEADKALETMKNLKDKELVDAGKVEQIKREVIAAKDTEITALRTEFTNALTDREAKLQAATGQIHDLMIGAQFRQSSYFTGTETNPPKTILPPDIAETYFSKHFKLEQDAQGRPMVVGYDSKGNQIYSRKKPGELADFEEAIGRIVEEYPRRDEILRAPGKGGSGGPGGGAAPNKSPIEAEIAKLDAAYKQAVADKRPRESVAIKNRLHQLTTLRAAGVTQVPAAGAR